MPDEEICWMKKHCPIRYASFLFFRKRLFIGTVVIVLMVNIGIFIVTNDYPGHVITQITCQLYEYVAPDYTLYIRDAPCNHRVIINNHSSTNQLLFISSRQKDWDNKTNDFMKGISLSQYDRSTSFL